MCAILATIRRLIRFDPGEDRQHTDADGVFHTVVIPGQGILGVQCDQWNDYCAGLGGEKLEVSADGRFATYNLTAPKAFNAVAEIDVPANAQSIERDLKVSRGINLKVNVQDPQGQPLKGVMATGLCRSHRSATPQQAKRRWNSKHCVLAKLRRVMLLHRDRHLGQILELTAPEKGGAPEARTVTLEPCGTVTGRIVNGEKEPVAGVQLTAFAGTPRNFDALVPQQVASDADGKFRFDFLPPGALYNISGFSPQFNAIEVAKEMKLAPGETVDFGTIDISSKKRPEPTRKQASAGAASATLVALASTTENAPLPAAKDSKRLIVHGRIVGVDGKPAAGADVAAIGMKAEQRPRRRSGATGRRACASQDEFRRRLSLGDRRRLVENTSRCQCDRPHERRVGGVEETQFGCRRCRGFLRVQAGAGDLRPIGRYRRATRRAAFG